MANRLFIDLKENSNNVITGTVKFPADSTFMFEALVEVLDLFSRSCEVPMEEIATDLMAAVRKQQGVELQ